jgi:hypothetical protein
MKDAAPEHQATPVPPKPVGRLADDSPPLAIIAPKIKDKSDLKPAVTDEPSKPTPPKIPKTGVTNVAPPKADSSPIDARTVLLSPRSNPEVPPVAHAPLMGAALVKEIEKELHRVGCYSGKIDGDWGASELKTSVRNFDQHVPLESDSKSPSIEFLEVIRSEAEQVCPPEWNARQVLSHGHCVPKECAKGTKLDAAGNCEPLAKGASLPAVRMPKDIHPPASTGSRTCTEHRNICLQKALEFQFRSSSCSEYFSGCMATGVWASRRYYINGVTKR